MHPFQAMIDGMSAQWQRERAGKQLTLGRLLAVLEILEPDRLVHGLGHLHSYRGYYDDLAFVPSEQRETVSDFKKRCQDAMGRTFEGYKGGDYVMGEHTPLWVSEYGRSSGIRLIDLDASHDVIVPVTKSEEQDG